MKKKIIYSFALIFFSFQFLTAQNKAEKIISDILINAKTNAIKTGFMLAVAEKGNAQVTTGTFILKGNKFVLEMDEMKAYFDGKTQWAYVPQNNEVSITEPTDQELSETNPMAILSGYKSKCNIRFSTKIKSTQNYCIEMLPKIKNQSVSKIEVQVNKNNHNLFSIKLTNKNGSTSLLSLSNFQKGVKVSDTIFAFNKNRYKGVVVNDLR